LSRNGFAGYRARLRKRKRRKNNTAEARPARALKVTGRIVRHGAVRLRIFPNELTSPVSPALLHPQFLPLLPAVRIR